MLPRIVFWSIAILLLLYADSVNAGGKSGSLVLAFDDGDESWVKTIAPELSAVGGRATFYISNSRIHEGIIGFEDLRILQDRYGFEIGTHTYHHYDAILYADVSGVSEWSRDELESSINELQAQGVKIRSMVFPFNKESEETRVEALKLVGSFRRYSPNPISDGISADGSLSARAVDFEHYVPLEQFMEWVDIAHRNNQVLALYGHRVLPDSEFESSVVGSVDERIIMANEKVRSTYSNNLCLVPDNDRPEKVSVKIDNIEGDAIRVRNGDMRRLTRPGIGFTIGPCRGMRLSDFRKFIGYAEKKLNFLTIGSLAGSRGIRHADSGDSKPSGK